VVAVVVLLALAAAALRGYLPGADRAPSERPTGSPASLFAVVAMLSVSMAVIAIAIITNSRNRRVAASTGGEPPREMGGPPLQLTWRTVLIGVGLIAAWLLIVALLSRLDTQLGLQVPPPESATDKPAGGQEPPPESEPPESGPNVFGFLAASTMLLLLLVAAGTAVAARRQRRAWMLQAPADDYRSSNPAPQSNSLARAAELGLAEIGDLSREPRAAIIACYAAMERELEKAPGAVPQDSDTPSEVLARAVEHHALHTDSATELVDLFEEARFSPHVMTEEHREAALRVLRLVLDDLRSVV
jgi:Domain of unknown function (DUF4129)